MFVGKDGHVGGSINRAQVAGLLAETDDEELKAYYRELLGGTEEFAVATPEPDPEAEPEPDTDLDELRAQAEALGVKVDGRWGEQRLREEIAAYEEV